MRNPYPRTTAAIAVLQNDSGCLLSFAVVAKWAARLPQIERELARLSTRQVDGFSELDHFVIGDPAEQRALNRRYDLRLAGKFLNAIFGG